MKSFQKKCTPVVIATAPENTRGSSFHLFSPPKSDTITSEHVSPHTVKTLQRILSIHFFFVIYEEILFNAKKILHSLRMLKILRNTKHILRIMKKSFVRF